MNGPYCHECRFFGLWSEDDDGYGECHDPTKRIYPAYESDPKNERPWVHYRDRCTNWKDADHE